jgi:Protein of unknown function (DUF3019)
MRFNRSSVSRAVRCGLWAYLALYLAWSLAPAALAQTKDKPALAGAKPTQVQEQAAVAEIKPAPSGQEFAFELAAKPNKCIALHKGQDCYQSVSFYWRTPSSGDFCLHAQGQSAPLYCWQGAGAPPFRYEFVGQETQQFYLRNQAGDTVRTTTLVVAWVYTSGKRDTGGWRLF